MVSKRVSTNEDSSGKDIVPQILQFHAEPESTSSKVFSICPIQKNETVSNLGVVFATVMVGRSLRQIWNVARPKL